MYNFTLCKYNRWITTYPVYINCLHTKFYFVCAYTIVFDYPPNYFLEGFCSMPPYLPKSSSSSLLDPFPGFIARIFSLELIFWLITITHCLSKQVRGSTGAVHVWIQSLLPGEQPPTSSHLVHSQSLSFPKGSKSDTWST